MLYEQELALEPARLDELNRLLEAKVAGSQDGSVIERFGVQFGNKFVMQLWIVNCDPAPRIQVVFWDHLGGRIGTSDLQSGPVEGKYEMEFLDDRYEFWVTEGSQTVPDGA
jgi:hypothetical protein